MVRSHCSIRRSWRVFVCHCMRKRIRNPDRPGTSAPLIYHAATPGTQCEPPTRLPMGSSMVRSHCSIRRSGVSSCATACAREFAIPIDLAPPPHSSITPPQWARSANRQPGFQWEARWSGHTAQFGVLGVSSCATHPNLNDSCACSQHHGSAAPSDNANAQPGRTDGTPDNLTSH